MNVQWPHISVVIPTEGRVELIRRMLDSTRIAAIRYNGQVEIIVVDSSPALTATEIEKVCQDFEVKYLRGPSSVRKKRNSGARISKGEIIQFIDSDCIASANLFKEHAGVYLKSPETAGICGLTIFSGNKNWHWWIIEKTGLVNAFSFAQKYDRVQWCTTSNFSVRRSIFEKVGGFEENFPFRLGGDDLDFTYRITRDGGIIRSNPAAVVYHSTETWKSPLSFIKRAFRWGRMGYHIFKRHPELRFFDLPKPMFIFFLFALLAFSKATFAGNISFIHFIVFFSGSFLLAKATFLARGNLGWPRALLPFVWSYDLIYHIGGIFEFLKHGDFQILYRRTVFSTYQLADEWPQNVHRHRMLMFCFLLGWIISFITQ